MTLTDDERGRLAFARERAVAAMLGAELDAAYAPQTHNDLCHLARHARRDLLELVAQLRRRHRAEALGAVLDLPAAAIDDMLEQLAALQAEDVASAHGLAELTDRTIRDLRGEPDDPRSEP